MTQTFDDKKRQLLSDLRILALRHNRDYYTSLIPFVENAGPEDLDLIEMYRTAILEDGIKLTQSRQALESIAKVDTILVS